MSCSFFGDNFAKMCSDLYGIKPMSIEEEAALPETVKNTRNNKMEMVDDCLHMINMINSIKVRARQIPEEDDSVHSALVSNLRDLVRSAEIAVEKALLYNGD